VVQVVCGGGWVGVVVVVCRVGVGCAVVEGGGCLCVWICVFVCVLCVCLCMCVPLCVGSCTFYFLI